MFFVKSRLYEELPVTYTFPSSDFIRPIKAGCHIDLFLCGGVVLRSRCNVLDASCPHAMDMCRVARLEIDSRNNAVFF
jgi:hypothetical protein